MFRTSTAHRLGFNYCALSSEGEVVYREIAFTETTCYLRIKKGNKCFHSALGAWHLQEGQFCLFLCLSGTWFGEAVKRSGWLEVLNRVCIQCVAHVWRN